MALSPIFEALRTNEVINEVRVSYLRNGKPVEELVLEGAVVVKMQGSTAGHAKYEGTETRQTTQVWFAAKKIRVHLLARPAGAKGR